MRVRTRCGTAAIAMMLLGLMALSPVADAASTHPTGAVLAASGSIFGSIASAVLGAFSWTVGLAGHFILVTLAALIRMMIPQSWARVPVQLFGWIVQIPNFAGQLTSPSGETTYGFAGVNAMRSLFEWIGLAFLPLTMTWAGGRALLGTSGPLAAPVLRVLALAAILIFYPVVWGQGAALVDQLTHLILSPQVVTNGIRQLMAYAVEGTALGGWQLIDLTLMGAIAVELLALILVKVIIVLVGAILYAVGPLMLAVVATEPGARLTRAWGSAVALLLALPVAWSIIFALGAVLIGDTSSAGALTGGTSTIEQLLGSVIVAVAGIATLWLCLRAAREISTLARGQLSVLHPTLAAARGGASPYGGQERQSTMTSGASTIRNFQGRVGTAAGTASSAMNGAAGAAGGHRSTGFARRSGFGVATTSTSAGTGGSRRAEKRVHAPAMSGDHGSNGRAGRARAALRRTLPSRAQASAAQGTAPIAGADARRNAGSGEKRRVAPRTRSSNQPPRPSPSGSSPAKGDDTSVTGPETASQAARAARLTKSSSSGSPAHGGSSQRRSAGEDRSQESPTASSPNLPQPLGTGRSPRPSPSRRSPSSAARSSASRTSARSAGSPRSSASPAPVSRSWWRLWGGREQGRR